MARSRRLAALDLGTTKVCCVVAEIDSDGLRVLGAGEAPSRGMRKGAVIDIERAAEAVAEAVDRAEKMSGVAIDAAIVGIAGGHITSQNSRGVVAVAAGHHEVRGADVNRAIEAARAVSVPSDRKIVHVLPRAFTVDGQEGVRDAIGMAGNRLEVETHIITGANTAIQNIAKVMHEAGLDVDDMVLQVLASAEAVVDEDEMERGVVVVDIGGGTTDIAVFHNGSIVHTAVLAIGGSHVTADLGVGLRCDADTAEAVKRQFGHALQLSVPADATVTLTPLGYDEPCTVPQRYLAEIIGPRAREIAQLISAEVERAGPSALYPGGLVLTGGGSLLRGFAEMVQQVTELPVRVSAPTGLHGMDEEIRGPHHATAVGLLKWSARSRGRSVNLVGRRTSGIGNGKGKVHSDGNGSGSSATNMSERFGRWFRELF